MIVLALFLAKLTNPLLLIGLVVGYKSRSPLICGVTIIFLALLSEVILHMQQYTRTLDPMIFAIGVAAASVWVATGWVVRRLRERWRPA